ncbi:claspin-like [Saccoglossus kowalevskii]|uniref:Claspin-like n=1 Tax=Saccoglossus kowalevskii TaxID=10224 RepID=A0ABM0MAK8_SACKO|nr:PREDICTED: claspin-like [Saccoglossus kowalevskii]
MQVPGAKLSKLKETLQAKMKMKRDQERKKREEAYQLDNEEGFEDDFMDDDGELTDKTDTDIEEEDDDDMGIEGIEKEADDDDGDDVIDVVNGGAAKNKTQKNVDGGSEFLSLKLLDTSIRSDPSASSGSSSFKTPAKVITGPNHSTDTMNLYDSTCSLPSDVSDLQPCDNDKNNSWKDFNFGLIEQKKGLIKHKSKDFGEYDFSDGENEMLKLAVESDKEEKDMPDIKNVSYNGLDASFDPASMIPAYQPGGGSTNQDHNKSATSGRNSPDFFTPFTKRQISTGSLQKSTGKLSDLSLPVEDSQDLFNSPARSHHSRNSDSLSQNFHFSLDDETQSQFLDENGFLNVRSTTKPKVSKRQLLLSDASNENLDELLGLCSGKFTEDTQSSSSSIKECVNPKPKGLFSHFSSGELASSCQRSSMDELLGLCSGTFTESSKEKTENTKENEEKEEDDDDGSDVSFHIMSDVEDEEDEDETLTKRKEKRRRVMQFSDEDDEDDDNMDGEEDHSVEEELSETEDEGAKPKVKAKPVPMPDFIEDEAELSGSEAGSDDEEGDYGDDEYEEDAIDEELPEADMLKDQINRIHMKTVEDDDARKLRLYKEMYLQDGDLWSDGKGRTRRFRWNNVEDESSQMDMFWKASDNEESDQETEEDLKWRKERYEREQWLEEQKQEKDGVFDIDEDSQFTKIIKNIQIKKKASPKKLPAPPPPKEKVKDKEVTVPKPLHQTMFRRGSFLCRSKKDLEKIAAMAKPVANPSGPKNSRNFVFQALSPPKDGVTKKPQVRRSISVTGAVEQSISKRPRLERSQSTVVAKTSIFEHFD